MSTSVTSAVPDSSVLSRRSTVALMLAMALAGAAGLMAWGPVGLVPHMHQFADARAVWGMPFGVNVWTHLPLLPIGLWGLWRVHCLPLDEPLRWVWGTFFCCQLLATAGGMVYHWNPGDLTFVWDQVPRSSACALFALAFLGERVDRRLGHPLVVAIVLAATLLSGFWWWLTLRVWQLGDLRPLIWLELAPVALVAAGAWTLHGRLLSRQDWLRSQLSFVVAQSVDWADRPLYEWTGHTLSGHSLRHLALAACVGWVAYRLGKNPRPAPAPAPGPWPEPLPADQTRVTSLPDSRLAS